MTATSLGDKDRVTTMNTSLCPASIARLTLPVTDQVDSPDYGSFKDKGGSDRLLYPQAYAVAAQVSWDFNLLSKGSWVNSLTDGRRVWQLCIEAPAVDSLTILFRKLKLPAEAELYITVPTLENSLKCTGPNCQKITLRNLRPNGAVLTAPIPGDTIILEYHHPVAEKRNHAFIEIRSVLLGLKQLRFVKKASNSSEEAAIASSSKTAGVVADANLNIDPSVVEDSLASSVEQAEGTSMSCQRNVACDSGWATEADAVVLLVGVSANMGIYCTATLINAPGNVQYVLSANHCLDSAVDLETEIFWGVLFEHQNGCDVREAPAIQMLQGLEVVWFDEFTDVLLLRLDDEIPEEYNPFFLGWDASGNAQPDSVVCIHHPRGDVKKIGYSFQPLGSSFFKTQELTHYLVNWDNGRMETGSSGSMLIDADTRLGLGPLTAGTVTMACSGGEDIFGSLFVAFRRGLSQFLTPGGSGTPTFMGSRQPLLDGPGLIVDPDLVVLEENNDGTALRIRLSEGPATGEQLLLVASIPDSGNSTAPAILETTEFFFTESDWEQERFVYVAPVDNSDKDGFVSFRVILELRSTVNEAFLKRRSIPGVVVDDDTPEGSTPGRPFTVSVASTRPFTGSGSLSGGGATLINPVLRSTRLEDFSKALPPGAAVYYAFRTNSFKFASLEVCSSTLEGQLYIFSPDGMLQWTSTKQCAGGVVDGCLSYQNDNGCSGFQNVLLLGKSWTQHYTIAIASKTARAGLFEFYMDVYDL